MPPTDEFNEKSTVIKIVVDFLFFKKYCYNKKKEREKMTQEELRKLYKERLTKEKQCYIAKEIKIDGGVLSRFKNGKIDLYPELFEKLENYLTK